MYAHNNQRGSILNTGAKFTLSKFTCDVIEILRQPEMYGHQEERT